MRLSKEDVSVLIGNALDHYNTSLYGLLVPIIAPLFFPQFSSVTQLILAYSLLATSFFTKPLGVLIFSLLAEKKGAAFGLSYSLIGVAIMVIIIGLLPIYTDAGIFAPLSLVVARLLLDMFSAGESNIAKIYILENKRVSEAKYVSYIYQVSNMFGIILASCFVSLIAISSAPEFYWRVAFWFGGITACFGLYLRKNISKEHKDKVKQQHSYNIFKTVWKEREGILKVAIVNSFSYVTYTIPFVFMNSFIPLVTKISFEEMMQLNTFLLVFDALALLIIGKVVKRFNPSKIMLISSTLLAITIIPLFVLVKDASLFYITIIRLWIVIIGVTFACFINLWACQQFNAEHRYACIGVGSILGGSTLGKLTPSICLILWNITEQPVTIALYICLVSVLTIWAIRSSKL